MQPSQQQCARARGCLQYLRVCLFVRRGRRRRARNAGILQFPENNARFTNI